MAPKGKQYLAGRETDEKAEDFEEYPAPEPRQPEQSELPGTESEPVKTVNGKAMAAEYVKPVYTSDEDGKTVAMEFSLALTPDHEKLLQENVLYHLKVLRKGGCANIGNIDMEAVVVSIYLAPDDKAKIELEYCEVEKCQLAVIEEKGKGKAVKVYRWSFRLVHPVTAAVCRFADEQFNKQLWIKMEEASPALIKEHRSDEE